MKQYHELIWIFLIGISTYFNDIGLPVANTKYNILTISVLCRMPILYNAGELNSFCYKYIQYVVAKLHLNE